MFKDQGNKVKQIRIYNSLTNKKENLTTQEPKKIKMYACGVTVYDDCHIGHAMQAIFFDVIRKFLEHCDYKVVYVRNYTDVDDKIINRAKKENITCKELSEKMIRSSREDMQNIGVAPASFEPRVSDSIADIISMIEILIGKHFAYVTKTGDVYFRVKNKENYGCLSNRNIEAMLVGVRSIHKGDKEHPLDFALWKNDQSSDASWNSPWGMGRPGWHIECSVLAKKYLGNSFDIHGGGRDLLFPHHENEIAQSEAANDSLYASHWLHSGLLTIEQQKMSKSLGNHITIKSFLKTWDAEVLRYSYLCNHYRSNIDFSEDVFKLARKRLFYYYQTLISLDDMSDSTLNNETYKESEEKSIEVFKKTFMNSMCDDFNTSQAIAALNVLIRKANGMLNKATQKSYKYYLYAQTIREVCSVLGLLQRHPDDFIGTQVDAILRDLGIARKQIQDKIKARNLARDKKDWLLSDKIRDELLKKGIMLKDLQGETKWAIAEL
jgi:cysteinyl-tRNA synthetase